MICATSVDKVPRITVTKTASMTTSAIIPAANTLLLMRTAKHNGDVCIFSN